VTDFLRAGEAILMSNRTHKLTPGDFNMAIGGHHSHVMKTDEWMTPPDIIDELGPFDLDPCANASIPWATASQIFTKHDDGLKQTWKGRVWLNPPYGPQTKHWLKKLMLHGNGIALIFARTETEMFFTYIWDHAEAVLFIKGRLHFHYADGTKAQNNSGGPSVLVAYGDYNAVRLGDASINGKFIYLK
jgi:hypothetical protein